MVFTHTYIARLIQGAFNNSICVISVLQVRSDICSFYAFWNVTLSSINWGGLRKRESHSSLRDYLELISILRVLHDSY